MALSEDDRAEIKRIMEDCLKGNPHECIYHRSDTAGEDIGHAWGVFKDLGDGDVSKGLEIVRVNNVWATKMQAVSNKIGMYVLIVIFAGLTTGVLAAFWTGIRHAITGTPK